MHCGLQAPSMIAPYRNFSVLEGEGPCSRQKKAGGRKPPAECLSQAKPTGRRSGFVMIDEASRGHREYKPRISSHRSRVDKRSVRAHR